MPIELPPLSRRDFLAGTVAAGAGLLWPGRLWAADEPADPNRLALLADTPVPEKRDRENHGVRPVDNFLAARAEILALRPRPAAMFIAGDLAFREGMAGDYSTLAELVRPIRQSGMPIYFVLGNHDNLNNFYKTFSDARPVGDPPVAGEHAGVVEAAGADWVLLDSLLKTNFTPGEIGRKQLEWLGGTLDARADRPAVVMAHHNPDRGGNITGLLDTAAFLKVLAPRKRAKAYFFGHTHAWKHDRSDELHLVNLPTLVWVFDKTQPRGWVDAIVRPDGMTLTLSALDKKHPAHGQKLDLKWRT